MTHINRQTTINAPREKVWAVLADLGAVQDYNPNVSRSHYNSGPREGVGASRHCDFTVGGSIEETAVAWKDGESFTLELHDGKLTPPFKTALGTFHLQPEGEGTRVSVDLEYSMKYGLLGALMDRFLVQSRFGDAITRTLAGLKQHVETVEETAKLSIG